MQPEQIQNFHQRLNQWVASQGFWFQVRYAMVGENIGGKILYHALKISTRLAIFAGIVLIAAWIYLIKRPESSSFSRSLRSGLQGSLGASQISMGHKRQQGYLEIARLGAEGAPDTFFSSLEARSVRCRMGLTDGLFGTWEPGIISIHRLDLDLRAGADDTESAKRMAQIVYMQRDRFAIQSIAVSHANIRWGFSTQNRGLIEDSQMIIQKAGTGWRISLKGGSFSQNWLHRLKIRELVVRVEPNKIIIEEASLIQGEHGTVEFPSLVIKTGARPHIEGKVRIRNLDLENTIPKSTESIVSGSFSADLEASGSTNLSEGIVLQGKVRVDSHDCITLRDQIPILQALSVIDFTRNYHRVDFQKGSFRLTTRAGAAEFEDIDLHTAQGLSIRGSLNFRPPNNREIKQAFSSGAFGMAAMLDLAEQSAFSGSDHADFTLLNAAKHANLETNDHTAEPKNLFERIRMREIRRKLESDSAARLMRMMRCEGHLVMSLPRDAFSKSIKLLSLYPVNGASGHIEVPIPIDGHIREITRKQAELIYQEGRR